MSQPPRVSTTGCDDVAPAEYASDGTFFTQIAAQLVGRAGLHPGDRVLDVGCGTGILTLAAARAVGPKGHVTGIDPSEPMLRRALGCRSRPGGEDIALARADAHHPPFAPGSFDAVVASMTVFLLAEPARAVRAWLRPLRPGGTLAFSWNVSEDPCWQPAAFRLLEAMRLADGSLCRRPVIGVTVTHPA